MGKKIPLGHIILDHGAPSAAGRLWWFSQKAAGYFAIDQN